MALGGGTGASPGASGSGAPTASPAGSPGATPAPSGAAIGGTDRPSARDELWVPIVLLVLVVLMAEWLVYQRDAATRLWRGFRRRFGGPGNAAGDAAPGEPRIGRGGG